ncbi:hypothetical protein TRFO_06158 [Tritrichomonas foetus]|uniref:Cilia- and flagella-associated protein 157 n=1 Tax=Tritrichomonas foetus TaxID=1144522 RepID=A0A1J4K195_9EUKA|nr:hypothetical protein TRFO_06158 [Tritrichomonas foetus]|eukprot:OHT04730.1 hypothetical protein TRFO_06158 [Tritrichomonas foetus]
MPPKKKDDAKPASTAYFIDGEKYIEEHTVPGLDQEIAKLIEQKNALKVENHNILQTKLSLERRNNTILEQLKLESAEKEKLLEEHKLLFDKTKAECQAEIQKLQIEIKADFEAHEKLLIEKKKERNHLRFNMQEKKEIDETRIAMLQQRVTLTQELKETTMRLNAELKAFERESYAFRNKKNQELNEELNELKAKAKADIDKEKMDTLREAESQSKVISSQVTKFQKVVVTLRDRYNKLLEEANELEMQMMEAKLVTQLTQPESNQNAISKLQEERDRIENQKLRAKTKPEAENRRKMTQHVNSMKKKGNELAGFIKLNRLKHQEMEQLRALAMNVIEQRNALMTFMNETMAALRREIAASFDQKGLPFRTTELILCHVNDGDEEILGREFATNENMPMSLSDTLRMFEVLYSRFTGVPQPRKVEEAI